MVCLQTGLLHDVVEDTSVTVEEIEKKFGDEVARCVDGVTKLSKLDFFSRRRPAGRELPQDAARHGRGHPRHHGQAGRPLHNMRTLGYLCPERRSASRGRPSRSTRPSRTASAWAKSAANWRISPSSTSSRTPTRRSSAQIESKRHANEEFLQRDPADRRSRSCAREGIPARVDGRVKRAYSVFQKLKRQKITLDQVYDLLALRIITDSVKNCYAALGVIHNEWRPIPGRIKDFIAIPRPNLYQSLHTSVVGPQRAALSKCRSAPRRCTASPKKASRRTGSTRKAARARPPTISASPGCATWSSGSATCRIPASSCPR